MLPLMTTAPPLPLLLRVGNGSPGLHHVLVDLATGNADVPPDQLFEEELGAEVYAAAWERGKELDFDTAVVQIQAALAYN